MAGPVIVVDYDPAWPVQFEELRRILAGTLGSVAVAIEHVGSTSVPGLAAKPILDIDVVVENRDALPEVVRRLAELGYEHEGDIGVRGREAFRPVAERPRAWPRHHLYVCARGARELERHVALRQWLRTHPEDRERYANLKRRLALEHRHDRDAYCDAKRGLIEAVLAQATGVGLCSERAVLRPFTQDDAPYAHPVFSDPQVMRYSAGEPDPDLAATLDRLQRYVRMQREHGFSKWAVWDRASGTYLGDAGLTVLPETGEVELGYRIARSRWGQGLATEIARVWLSHALGELELPRIIAFADPRNPASVRVMEKIGMTFVREDHLAGIDCVVFEASR
jgi:GrpB-like predicted nucleotidyltransferase (UPF0157 family)/RimJ/RimL family protein N-acetyltransferase